MELHFYDDIKSMKLYALKRENKYKPMIRTLFIGEQPYIFGKRNRKSYFL